MARKNKRVRSGVLPKSKTSKSRASKIKINAVKKVVDGIQFKSMLEVFTYRKLKEAGISFTYEEDSFTIMAGFHYPESTFESRKTSTELEDKSKAKVRDITYTPDFIGRDKDGKILWVIECKGFANERFPNTWKLFKKYLIDTSQVCPLYLPKNQGQVLKVIDLVTELTK